MRSVAVLLAGTSALYALHAVQVQARPMHAGINYERYLKEKDGVADELRAWMDKYKDVGEKNGWIPPAESRSAEEVEEDRMQRFFMSKELVEQLTKENPEAVFSTNSPFSLLTTEEFVHYIKNSYIAGGGSRALRRASAVEPLSADKKEDGGKTLTFDSVTKSFVSRSEGIVGEAYHEEGKGAGGFSFSDLVDWISNPEGAPQEDGYSDDSIPEPNSDADNSDPEPAPEPEPQPEPVDPEPQPEPQPEPAPAPAEESGEADRIDWSSSKCMPPIQNQGQCGSCWSFATIAAVESTKCLVSGGNGYTKLSEQFLAFCDNRNSGCNGGATGYALEFLQHNGACTAQDVPYTAGSGHGGSCNSGCNRVSTGMKGHERVSGESGLVSKLNKHPVVIAVAAGNNAWKQYAGGVLSGCDTTEIDHAVLAVGYDGSSFKIRNSWGSDWGENGCETVAEEIDSPRFAFVHPTAVVHPLASLGQDVHIGPYCVVGQGVRLDDGVVLQSHVVVEGHTRIGRGTRVHPFACLGGEPQDKKHQRSSSPGSDWHLVIGAHCVIREHVTIHGCTSYSSHTPTTLGDHCWILCGAHVGHDVRIGQRVVLSNNVCVAGHVEIGDCAIIGGQVGLKQHIKVGSLAMVGGGSAVDADVLPYGLVSGNRAKLLGLNLVGLRRAGISRHEIKLMLRVVRYLFGSAGSNVTAVCPKTGFAPALDLPYHDSIWLRVDEAQRHLAELNATPSSHPLVHEMYKRMGWCFFRPISDRGIIMLPTLEPAATMDRPPDLQLQLFEYQRIGYIDELHARTQWHNGDISVWTPGQGLQFQRSKTLATGQSAIASMQLHPRKPHLIVLTQPHALLHFELRSFLLLHKGYTGVVCQDLLVKSGFSPDGRFVVTGSEDGVPQLFQSLQGQRQERGVWGHRFFHGHPVMEIAWHPRAHIVALCAYGANHPVVVLGAFKEEDTGNDTFLDFAGRRPPSFRQFPRVTMKLHSLVAGCGLLLVVLLDAAHAVPKYAKKIPNGSNVAGVTAVGHEDPDSGGKTNAFGKAFAAADYTWSVAFCKADSDGDGQTNGEELGDPCCVWKEGSAPAIASGATDPGSAKSKLGDEALKKSRATCGGGDKKDDAQPGTVKPAGSDEPAKTPAPAGSTTPATPAATPAANASASPTVAPATATKKPSGEGSNTGAKPTPPAQGSGEDDFEYVWIEVNSASASQYGSWEKDATKDKASASTPGATKPAVATSKPPSSSAIDRASALVTAVASTGLLLALEWVL
ncbi:hypothetical protein ATCC90586_003112 [Pythium insidiosum]|nr:hypothetical protein ATCC90586_003112 [Pythium insidiosum]